MSRQRALWWVPGTDTMVFYILTMQSDQSWPDHLWLYPETDDKSVTSKWVLNLVGQLQFSKNFMLAKAKDSTLYCHDVLVLATVNLYWCFMSGKLPCWGVPKWRLPVLGCPNLMQRNPTPLLSDTVMELMICDNILHCRIPYCICNCTCYIIIR